MKKPSPMIDVGLSGSNASRIGVRSAGSVIHTDLVSGTGRPFFCKCLVVDDVAGLRELVKTMLGEKYQHLIVEAENVAQALEQLHDHPSIEVVITDKDMPGRNGFELISECRVLNPQVTCILMTGDHSVERQIESSGIKPDLVLVKPFDKEDILNFVDLKLGDIKRD